MHRRELPVRRLLSRRISRNEHEALVHAPPATVEIVRRKSGQTVLIETGSQTALDLTRVGRRLAACGMTERADPVYVEPSRERQHRRTSVVNRHQFVDHEPDVVRPPLKS